MLGGNPPPPLPAAGAADEPLAHARCEVFAQFYSFYFAFVRSAGGARRRLHPSIFTVTWCVSTGRTKTVSALLTAERARWQPRAALHVPGDDADIDERGASAAFAEMGHHGKPVFLAGA